MSRTDGRPDSSARALAVSIALGRIGIGLVATLATRPGLRLLGFGETDARGRALAKLAGGRDVALGALALAARDDRAALRTACVAGAAVDASDAIAFGTALARGEDLEAAGPLGAIAGAAAAAAGAWAANRLGES